MRLEKIYSACDWCHEHESETLLIVPPDIGAQWWAWTRVHPDLELLALFTAVETVDPGWWTITRMWLPRQHVTVAECEVLESSEGANGMIHSHHSMAACMSNQDKRDLIPSYQFSMVTNHKGEAEAYERITLPCGGVGFRQVEVMFDAQDVAAVEVEQACYTPPQEQQTVPAQVIEISEPRKQLEEYALDYAEEYEDGGWPLYAKDTLGRRAWRS